MSNQFGCELIYCSVVHLVNVAADVLQVEFIPFIQDSAQPELNEIISGRSFIQNKEKYREFESNLMMGLADFAILTT